MALESAEGVLNKLQLIKSFSAIDLMTNMFTKHTGSEEATDEQASDNHRSCKEDSEEELSTMHGSDEVESVKPFRLLDLPTEVSLQC